VDRHRRLRDQVGDRIGRVEAITGVGDVVDPQLILVVEVVLGAGHHGLELTLIEVGPEQLGQDHSDPGRSKQWR
jgi:hypothetical protein